MAQKYNPATGQWEDDTTTSTGGDPTSTVTTQSPSFLAGDQYTPPAASAPQTADPSLLGPNYSGPAPASFGGPATSADQVPVPSVNPGVVYTDPSGRGYNPSELYANRNTLLADPANARIRDILTQYGYGAPAAQSVAASTPSSTASASAPAGATAAGVPTSDFQSAVRQLLMKQLGEASSPVDPNAPEIAATLSSASDAGQRASDAERTALAERLYAQGGGLNTNALTQQVQQSGEKQAATLSTLKGQLLMNQYQMKHQQLQQDLQLAIQSGDAEAVRQTQLAIANLQAAVQREGIGVNLAEFGAQLDQNSALAGLHG